MCTKLDNNLSAALPRDWTDSIRCAVLNIVVLVRIATLAAREFLIQEGDVVHAKLFRLEAEVAMLREELRINGTRRGESGANPGRGESGDTNRLWGFA